MLGVVVMVFFDDVVIGVLIFIVVMINVGYLLYVV